jgi:hypothetical protein
MDLFMHLKSFANVVTFAQSALQNLSLDSLGKHTKTSKAAANAAEQKEATILSSLFTAALKSAQYAVAYSALTRINDAGLRKASLTALTTTLVTHRRAETLLSLPFASLSADLDAVLSSLAYKSLASSPDTGRAYVRVLYALRIHTGNYHGAAQILWTALSALKSATVDPRDERIASTYLLVINALRCCGPDEQWVLDDPAALGASGGVKFVSRLSGTTAPPEERKRRVVFLGEIRKEYQSLLDRISDLEGGRFAFAPIEVEGEGMEVDVF